MIERRTAMGTTRDCEDANEWMMTLATEKDKRRIRMAINRGLGLPDHASDVAAMHAAHVTDGRDPEAQAAAYYRAYLTLPAVITDVEISDERQGFADWLEAEANRQEDNGFAPNPVGAELRRLVDTVRSGVDLTAEAVMVQQKADDRERSVRKNTATR